MITATNKPQMYGPSRAGQLVKGCSVHAPAADQAQGHVHSFVAGSAGFSTSRLSEFRSTGRGFGLGTFSADGRDCNPGLASINDTADQSFHDDVKPLESHSSAPSLYGINRRAGASVCSPLNQSIRYPR